MEFRRISAFIYKKALRWRKAVALAKQDKLYKVTGVLLATLCMSCCRRSAQAKAWVWQVLTGVAQRHHAYLWQRRLSRLSGAPLCSLTEM